MKKTLNPIVFYMTYEHVLTLREACEIHGISKAHGRDLVRQALRIHCQH